MGNRLPNKILPYSAIYIDLNFDLLMQNLKQFVKPTDRKVLEEQLAKIFIRNREQERMFVTLSVRTVLDLLLRGLAYPTGSEVIMTAINIPQMAQIIRYHGLVPIPLEINQQTLLPKEEELEKAVNSKTKAIMVSSLFGSILDMEMVLRVAKKHNLFVIEDAAESFIGPQYNGHPEADFTCFSFGTIKNYTAFGGAVSILRNHESLYRKMKQTLDSYPVQTNKFYAKKYLKGIFASILLSNRPLQLVGKRVTYFFGIQHQEFVVSLVRGFEIHHNFLETFRYQVPVPMLALILLRIAAFDKAEFIQDTKKQMRGLQYLKDNKIGVIGTETKERYFWLFPILVPDKELCLRLLQKRGIEPYTGATQLRLIQSPHGSRFGYPEKTGKFFEDVLYLPISKGVRSEDIMQIVKEVVEVVNEIKNTKVQPNNNAPNKLTSSKL